MPESPKHVLLTGAASGLGRAITLHLARPGDVFFLHYAHSGAAAAALAETLATQGTQAHPLQADLTCPEERESLLQAVHARTTALNLFVNNAALYPDTPLLETEPEDFRAILELGCTAVQHLLHRARPLLARGAPAQMIQLGDSGAERICARPHATAYHIAKLGAHVLVRSYAQLLVPQRIRVNQISPGFLEGSLGQPGAVPPAWRPGRYADILAALDFLSSPQAEYITGANLVVSGGWNL